MQVLGRLTHPQLGSRSRPRPRTCRGQELWSLPVDWELVAGGTAQKLPRRAGTVKELSRMHLLDITVITVPEYCLQLSSRSNLAQGSSGCVCATTTSRFGGGATQRQHRCGPKELLYHQAFTIKYLVVVTVTVVVLVTVVVVVVGGMMTISLGGFCVRG